MDSRTSVELIFDQGLGDVFSVRIAGNIINVKRTVHAIMERSPILKELIETATTYVVPSSIRCALPRVSFSRRVGGIMLKLQNRR